MNSWLTTLTKLSTHHIPAVSIVIVKTSGSSPAKSGAKLIVSESGIEYGTIGGGQLEQQAIIDAQSLLTTHERVKYFKYPLGAAFGQCCGGSVEVLMEVMNKAPQLYIFGAGHIGYALANIMKNTAFDIHLIDSRENWFEQFQQDESIMFIDDETEFYPELVSWHSERTYIIILTHLHDLDQDIVEFSIKNKSKYIGLIGSQTKWKLFQKRISDKNKSANGLDRVHCPVGLDIGAESPQEIAISIASELIQVYYGK